MSAAILAVACSAGAGAVIWFMISSAATPGPDGLSELNEDAPSVIVALGDSFMSGEGTGAYAGSTSTTLNRCHRSQSAYPYGVAEALGTGLVFAACSGATSYDILGDHPVSNGQYPESPDGVLGAEPQLRVLEEVIDNKSREVFAVLVSIGGNDAQFGDIVRTCLRTRCDSLWSGWMGELDRVALRVDAVHDAIADAVGPTTRVLIMTYPQPIAEVECGPLGEQLTLPEVGWVLNFFLPRLNDVIEFSAATHGFEIVDMSNLFEGRQLCETEYTQAAVNAFAAQRIDAGLMRQIADGSLVQGSFHPNVLGHSLMTDAVIATLESFNGPTTGSPGTPIAPPGMEGCPTDTDGECLMPPGPPPDVSDIGVPYGEPTPSDIPCQGVRDEPAELKPVAESAPFSLRANAGSTVCYRPQLGEWISQQVGDSGEIDVPTASIFALGTPMEVWYHDGADEIDKVVLVPPNGFEAQLPAVKTGKSTGQALRLGLGALGLVLVSMTQQAACYVHCRRQRRHALR